MMDQIQSSQYIDQLYENEGLEDTTHFFAFDVFDLLIKFLRLLGLNLRILTMTPHLLIRDA